MSLGNTLFGNAAIPALFSFLSLNLGIASFIGCDFVRLNFGPINDTKYLFPNDEWFGLGLFRMQDYSTNKSSLVWEHSNTCYDYDDISKDMFASDSVESASRLFMPSVILSAVALIALLASVYKGGASKGAILISAVAAIIAAILQAVTFSMFFRGVGDDVCSKDHYETWYEQYPSVDYPKTNYVRFFSECTLGTTGKIAVAGFAFQFAAAIFAAMNYKFATPADHTIVSAIPAIEPMLKGQGLDYEEHGNERSFEVNPPVKRPAGEDDLSYVNDIEDSVARDEDLSLAETAGDSVLKGPSTPFRAAKSIDAGQF
mmetsp:Transcript_18825/g.27506  ORF Transcript_18825/g.27506 Transcript_18825/m.27506 type:complete len:315 (+) Transcript_18825:148-1092(+)|eukprot:CAMPEP_0197233444 /NCGR_PEP_ID=MMETSP1429-20130617/1489_1 /TAXON_ID=49237 /ORGANISM="Chaetoceros  sp., Strain UNC1202" /LENGTH=314 /DNA_ID=CAMNT_0042691683 /DNA_START=121 /DNA_END=1065 /DNA_ORIENTATION=-